MLSRLRALLVLVALLHFPSPACGDVALPLKQGYRRIAAAIRSKNLAAFLAENYSWRNPDGTLPSRQELESVWRANFAAVHAYAVVSFSLEHLAITGQSAVAFTRRTVFYTLEGSKEEQLEVSRSRDCWEMVRGHWRFAYREALPGSVTGRVLDGDPPPESPRLRMLSRSLHSGGPGVLHAFWRDMQGRTPLIEPIREDPAWYLVTFLWRGRAETTREVKLRGGLPSEKAKSLVLLPGTDVWYRTERLPADARFAYSLWVTVKVHRQAEDKAGQVVWAITYPPDPLNPHSINDGPYAELPKAPLQPWSTPFAGVPKGQLLHTHMVSRLLNEERALTVYTPAGYAQAPMSCRLLILFDGEDYQSLIPTPTLLDNLIAQGKVAPIVALFVHSQGTRFRDLLCSPAFADFVATELLPWARARYRILPGPSNVTVGGVSLGGLMAGYCGLRHSEVFGNVLSQSGAFWHGVPAGAPDSSPMPEDGWLARQYAATARVPLRLWLEVGSLESVGMVNNNRRLRDVLSAKGYDIIYSEFTGGHDFLTWRGSLANALMALMSASAPAASIPIVP